MSVADSDNNFWQKRLPACEILGCADNMRFGMLEEGTMVIEHGYYLVTSLGSQSFLWKDFDQ